PGVPRVQGLSLEGDGDAEVLAAAPGGQAGPLVPRVGERRRFGQLLRLLRVPEAHDADVLLAVPLLGEAGEDRRPARGEYQGDDRPAVLPQDPDGARVVALEQEDEPAVAPHCFVDEAGAREDDAGLAVAGQAARHAEAGD